jgi:hypothetical protein
MAGKEFQVMIDGQFAGNDKFVLSEIEAVFQSENFTQCSSLKI